MFNHFSTKLLPKTIALALVLGIFIPSATIVWFMLQAMDNERLATKQKIMELYQKQLSGVQQQWQTLWQHKINQLQALDKQYTSYHVIHQVATQRMASSVIDNRSAAALNMAQYTLPQDTKWQHAKRLEFVHKQLEQAQAAYETIALNANSRQQKALAYQAWVRCLIKLKQPEHASKVTLTFASHPDFQSSLGEQGRHIVANTLLMILELQYATSLTKNPMIMTAGNTSKIKQMLVRLINNNSIATLGTKQRLFVMNKLLKLDTTLIPELTFPAYSALQLAEQYQEHALTSEEITVNTTHLQPTLLDDVWQIRLKKPAIIALYHLKFLQAELNNLYSQSLEFSISLLPPNQQNQTLEPLQAQRLRINAGSVMPGWQIQLSLHNSTSSEDTASSQIAAYRWIGMVFVVCVIMIILLITHYIFRQQQQHNLKNDLMATVTHELKTPLSSMRMFVDLLLNSSEPFTQTTQDYLQIIAAENRRLSRLIDNFLTFSRMDLNKQLFNFQIIEPAALAKQALHPLLDKLQAERFELDVDIANTLPKIVADPDMLVVLLSNLLENAYKYSAEKKYIKLSVYCEGQTLTFAVSDHGIGLSPSDCQKVFDGFYRVKTEAQHNTQGCGLGLNIAKYIVENHQGSISASSELGQGTTFTVKLPLHQGATT